MTGLWGAVLCGALLVGGCHAQVPSPGSAAPTAVSPELARRIALMIRAKAQLPFNYDVKVSDRHPSAFTGYDEVSVLIGEIGKPLHPMNFLLSADGKTLAQMSTFDLAANPALAVNGNGRPARGGPEKAPVNIVVFDDLECPFCAKMHAQMFPAITERYGKNVRVTYKDFPLTTIHPWAQHAAVDAQCLADESIPAYWGLVDYLHEHLDEIGIDATAKPAAGKDPDHTLPVALKQVDHETLAQGTKHKVDEKKLAACVERQDETKVKVSEKEGELLNINGVPALFINGQQINGAVPMEYVFRAVDEALAAQGITPPPPVPIPSLETAPASSAATQ